MGNFYPKANTYHSPTDTRRKCLSHHLWSLVPEYND